MSLSAVDTHYLHVTRLHVEVDSRRHKTCHVNSSVDIEWIVVDALDGVVVEAHDIAVDRYLLVGELERSSHHVDEHIGGVEIEESVKHGLAIVPVMSISPLSIP